MSMRPLEQAARDQGVELYYHAVDAQMLPDASALRAFDALEEVLFIGVSKIHNILLVIYMYRDEDIIRIISARKATQREVKLWQKEK